MAFHSLSAFSLSEYVNAQELGTDMKSITDRAAQTLLWTELFRGQTNAELSHATFLCQNLIPAWLLVSLVQ